MSNYNDFETEDSVEMVLPDEPAVSSDSAPEGRLPVVKQLTIVSSILFGVFLIGGTPFVVSNLTQSEESGGNMAAPPASTNSDVKNEENPFANIALEARSAIVIDVKQNKVLYQKAPDTQWPLASITKLMTALVAREIVDEGAVIPVTAEALSQDGESGFALGDRFSYRKLSDLVLLTSSNDGAYALAASAGNALSTTDPASAFVKAMNVRAKELGLDSTYFRNPTGLDISETEAGAYGTASEVAELMEYLLANHPDILEETTKRNSAVYSESGGRHNAENTNVIVDAVTTVLGSKTGYTTLAGGNLVMAFDAGVNRPVVVVVLGSSHQGRFRDMLRLVEAARAELQK